MATLDENPIKQSLLKAIRKGSSKDLGEIIFEGMMDYGNRKFLAINDGLIEILNHEVSNMGIQMKENTEPNKEAKRYISLKNI